jgi:hypothetical protein
VGVDVTATATESESEVGAETRNGNQSGGLVTGLPRLHVSLESANVTRSVTTIVSETVPGSERETGTGLLGAAVGTAVRVVRAVAVVAVVVVVADTVESTATGHWPREWDSDILSHETLNTLGRTCMCSQPFMDQPT